MPKATISVAAPLKPVGGTTWQSASYPVQSLSLSWSWGSEPAEANLVYVSANPITIGSAVQIQVGGYFFAGICERDTPLISSGGNHRQLSFKDYRRYLPWDKAYGAFNQQHISLVGGVRTKRYVHILPWNHSTRRRTWTNAPLSAADILGQVLSGPGIETPWTVGYLDNAGAVHAGWHPALSYPLLDYSVMTGKGLAQVFLDVCEQTGLVFTLMPTKAEPFRLVFALKGVNGPDMQTADWVGTDQRESGTALAGHPTRVRVLGDRNLYQVHDIVLQPDWNGAWVAAGFYDLNVFAEYIYSNADWSVVGDPEHIIARQNALARALEITVREFDQLFGGNAGTFLDPYSYQGKCRNDLPAALYIQNILFRLFRLPDNFFFTNTYGARVYADSLEVQDRLLAGVTHHPTTGASSYAIGSAAETNAYVIVQGYQVGKDLFESLKPERFNLSEWNRVQDIWQKIDVSVENYDDDRGPRIIFAEPVIRCADLVEMIDGYAVLKARPAITVPTVKATLCFAAEDFSWFQTLVIADPSVPPADPVMGTQVHDEVLPVSGLNGEFLCRNGTLAEVPYADGNLCRTRAIIYANGFLRRQQVHAFGRFRKPLPETQAYLLHGKLDRVSLEYSPNGMSVEVELTDTRPRETYTPEAELDRARQLAALLPAQVELKRQANYARLVAAAARSSRDAYTLMSEAFGGLSGQRLESQVVPVRPGTLTTIPAGSVFVKKPNTVVAGAVSNTLPIIQQDATSDHVEFAGVAVRHHEPLDATKGGQVRLQTRGPALALVKGPIAVGQSVGIDASRTDNVLIKDGVTVVGVARQAIADTTTKLVRVELGVGGGGGGSVLPVWI